MPCKCANCTERQRFMTTQNTTMVISNCFQQLTVLFVNVQWQNYKHAHNNRSANVITTKKVGLS